MSAIRVVTDGDFEREIIKSTGPVLVDFWAEWCGPCKALAPVFESAARDYDGVVQFAKVDVDRNPETRDRFDVRGIPMLALFKKGQIIGRLLGTQSRARLAEFLDTHLALEPGEAPEILIPTRAFSGDVSVKQKCIERLRAHIAERTAMPGPTMWDGAVGSPLGCAAHEDTLAACARQIGAPPSLVALVDNLTTCFGTAAAGANFALSWLDAVPVGADLSPIPLSMIKAMLEGGAIERAVCENEKFAAVRDRVVAMHCEAATGAPSLDEWAALREQISSMPGANRAPLSRCLQAACGPITDPELLASLQNAAGSVVYQQAIDDAGWTEQDEKLAGQRFAAIHKDLSARANASPDAVQAEFRRVDPDFADRFTDQAAKRYDAICSHGQNIATMLLDRSRAARHRQAATR